MKFYRIWCRGYADVEADSKKEAVDRYLDDPSCAGDDDLDIEKAIDDTAEKIAPTPDRYKKQQEVWDSYQYIKFHHKNLRGTTTEEMCKRENCTEKEAQMYMIFEDCQDMGIKMNIAYADRLTGASDEREQMARLEKQFPTQQATYQTETLPGHTRLTREEVAAKYAAQK